MDGVIWPLMVRPRLSHVRARKVPFLESGVSDQGRQIIVQRPFPPPVRANSRTHRETNCPPISDQGSLIRADVTPELWALFVRAFRPWNLTRHTIHTWARSRTSIYAGFEGVLLMGKSVVSFRSAIRRLGGKRRGKRLQRWLVSCGKTEATVIRKYEIVLFRKREIVLCCL